jgi:hypothetical protein
LSHKLHILFHFQEQEVPDVNSGYEGSGGGAGGGGYGDDMDDNFGMFHCINQ